MSAESSSRTTRRQVLADLEQALVEPQRLQSAWGASVTILHNRFRELIDQDDEAVGDRMFVYCLKEACSAPLAMAVGALSFLGVLFARPPNGPIFTISWPALVQSLDDVDKAMRRPGLLQLADELTPHSTGRMLLAMATTIRDRPDRMKVIAVPTVPGALQLLCAGATLAARPPCSAWRLYCSTSLVVSHVWLLKPRPQHLPQAEVELLHSDAYLQALVQFAVHVQALTKKEHQLLANKSAVPRAQRDVPCGATPDASEDAEILPLLSSAQAMLLEATWVLVKRRQEHGIRPVMSQEIADILVQIYCQAAMVHSDAPATLTPEYMGILLDGLLLLSAAGPAASASVKSAAANAMAAGLAAVLLPAGSMPKLLKDEDVLPWQAIHSMTYMAIQLTWRTVMQLLNHDDKSVVDCALGLIPNRAIVDIVVACIDLPLSIFAVPHTRSGRQKDMLLMAGHRQMADMYLCVSRVPTLLKDMGRPISAQVIRCALLAGCQFVLAMVNMDTVAACVVPAGIVPSTNAIILMGFTELGNMFQSFALDWPKIYMQLNVIVLLMDAVNFSIQFAARPENEVQVCDTVNCCKCLCGALCTVATKVYGPCAKVRSISELVHGEPAHGAVLHLQHVQASIEEVHARMPKNVAKSLRGCIAVVKTAIALALPAPSSQAAKEVAAAAGSMTASEMLLAASALPTGRSAARPAARQGRAPQAMPPNFSPKRQPRAVATAAAAAAAAAQRGRSGTAIPRQPASEEQQQAASAAADRMAQLLMEEEAAAAAAKGAKQARKKPSKKGEKAASPPPDIRQQPLLPEGGHAHDTAGGMVADNHAPVSGGVQHNAQSPAQPGANTGAEAPPRPGSVADNSWQLCALSKVRMKDPVIASDSNCYERAALEAWVAQHGAVSPVTQEAIRADFVPNHSLRSLLQALQQPS